MGDRQKMFLCLVRELGIEVEVNRKFGWLTNRITPSEEALWRIFIALDGDPEGLCQVNRINSEISVNCRWPLYAISMA